jgi:hypothetical protein
MKNKALYYKEYYEKNKEKFREAERRYRKKNREKINEKNRKYRKEKEGKVPSCSKEYRRIKALESYHRRKHEINEKRRQERLEKKNNKTEKLLQDLKNAENLVRKLKKKLYQKNWYEKNKQEIKIRKILREMQPHS